MKFNDEPKHESHGMIGLSHVSWGGRGATLYGSPVKSWRTVRICIKEGREMSTKDGILGRFNHGGKIIAELEMSPTQFAEMLTTPGHGDGVPCTLRYFRDGKTLRKCGEPPAWESDAAHIRRKFGEAVAEQTENLHETRRRIDALLEEGNVSKARREKIAAELQAFYRLLTDSAPFVMEQFEAHTAQTVQVAKAEISGFVEGMARETGIAALRQGVSVPALEGGDE